MQSLNGMIRSFNRYELKYLLPVKKAIEIRDDLLAYLTPDNHGDGDGIYQISSLYYDSPERLCYWEKLDGIKYRRKLRIRYYDVSQPLQMDSLVMVEIKQRLNRVTQKRRAILPYRDAVLLCNDRVLPYYTLKDDPVVQEVFSYLWDYELKPASVIRYTRQALVGGPQEAGLRVTFDKDMTYQITQPDLLSVAAYLPLFPLDVVIMEIKTNDRIPIWLTELVGVQNLSMARVSKYCQSIELSKNVQNISCPIPLLHYINQDIL